MRGGTMYVNIEFLDSEPIENMITCMNFRMDKVIFFGYEEVIRTQRDKAESFLKEYCEVKDVDFFALSHTNMKSIETMIRKVVERERKAGNQVFFDITGGENLILVTFGMLAKELKVPVHFFDIVKDELIELDMDDVAPISKQARCRKIKMDLAMFVSMQGAVIDHSMKKDIKKDFSIEDKQQIQNVWKVFDTHRDVWSHFANFLQKHFEPEEDLRTCVNTQKIEKLINSKTERIKSVEKLRAILRDLAEIGMLNQLQINEDVYAFQYASRSAQNILWDAGSILELHTYFSMKEEYDDCEVGVHIDWDGVMYADPDADVLNEIDVFAIKGNVPTFVSCKSGKWDSNKSLNALYELETVANRLGGKYAKKELALVHLMGEVYMNRAEEMNIKVTRY